MAIVENIDRADENNYSIVCDNIVRKYMDKFASCFIMYHLANKLDEELDYTDLYVPELDRFIDFKETLPLWEKENHNQLGDILVTGLFNYCLSVSGKYPKKPEDFYIQRWENNIAKGIKNINQ